MRDDAASPATRRRLVAVALAAAGVAALGAAGMSALRGASALPARPVAVAPGVEAGPSKALPGHPLPDGQERAVQATRLFAARGNIFAGRAALESDPHELLVGKSIDEDAERPSAAGTVLTYPLAARPECLAEATLALEVGAVAGGPAEVGIYPGAATSLLDDRSGESAGTAAASLLDNRPRGVTLVKDAGLVEVDVTSLTRVWSAGGPFPSTGRRIPPGTPLLLVLRPTTAAAGSWTVRLTSPPVLTLRLMPGC